MKCKEFANSLRSFVFLSVSNLSSKSLIDIKAFSNIVLMAHIIGDYRDRYLPGHFKLESSISHFIR